MSTEPEKKTDWDKEHLTSLTKAGEEAIKRFRYVFILINIAGIIILSAQFNGAFSWLRQVLDRPATDGSEFQKIQTISRDVYYRDLWVTSIPLLGIKFSSTDLNIIGPFGLLVLAGWGYLASLKENVVMRAISEIGTSETDKDRSAYLLDSVAHYFVLQPIHTPGFFINFVVLATLAMPCWIPLAILASDAMTLFSANGLWDHLSDHEKCELTYRWAICVALALTSLYWFVQTRRRSRDTHRALRALVHHLGTKKTDVTV